MNVNTRTGELTHICEY